jgi:hypothetical protein
MAQAQIPEENRFYASPLAKAPSQKDRMSHSKLEEEFGKGRRPKPTPLLSTALIAELAVMMTGRGDCRVFAP